MSRFPHKTMPMRGYNLELLASLSGCECQLFNENGHVSDCFVTRIGASEHQLLERLGTVVLKVRRLQSFIKVNGLNSLLGDCTRKTDRYMTAFAEAIDGILDDYEGQLVSIEDELNVDDDLQLTHVYARITAITNWWLDELVGLLDQVENNPPFGVQLLSLLYTMRNNAVYPVVIDMLDTLLARCHHLFQHDLLVWICRAEISGPEFSIQRLDTEEDDNPWRLFCILNRQTPAYMDEQSRKNLLFIGHAVRFLCSNSNGNSAYELKMTRRRRWTPVLETVFEEGKFHPESLECAISECVSETSGQVWLKLLPNGNDSLVAEIEQIGHYYFLRRAAIWAVFCGNTADIFDQPPSPCFDSVLQKELKAIILTLTFSDSTVDNVHLSTDFPHSNTAKKPSSNWHALTLSLSPINRSLSLLLPATLYTACTTVFRTLLHVCSVQVRLDRLYLGRFWREKNTSTRRLWLLRLNMMSFIRSYQFFLHLDSISPLFNNLKKSLLLCTDYQRALTLMDEFGDIVVEHCGLNAVVVQEYIEQVLLVCSQFCQVVQNIPNFNDESMMIKVIEQFEMRFRRLSQTVFRVLMQKNNDDPSGRLQPLIQRLQFSLT